MKAALDGSAEGSGALRDVVGKGMTKVRRFLVRAETDRGPLIVYSTRISGA